MTDVSSTSAMVVTVRYKILEGEHSVKQFTPKIG